jgi:hypothetical protein
LFGEISEKQTTSAGSVPLSVLGSSRPFCS